VWRAQADTLIVLAAQHGFEPFWVHKRRPAGAGYTAWRDAFLTAHRY
jgi:hypothetical protein